MANLDQGNSTIEAYPFTLDRYFDEVLQNNPRSALMKYEWARFASFDKFPRDSPARPLRLAQCGFYYTGTADNVVCFSCNAEYGKWQDGDDAASIHKQINRNCGFVTGEDQSNIPIHDKSGPIGQNDSLPATRKEPGATAAPTSVVTDGAAAKTNPPLEVKQHCAFGAKDENSYRTHGVKHPDYVDVKKRSESFKDWPCEHIVSRQVLVAAGFVYAGVGDCVRCFYCGLGLRNWEKGDGPWEEHARWSQRCQYVLEEMGLQFVRQHATETDEVPHHQSQVGTPAKPTAMEQQSTVGTPAKPTAVKQQPSGGTPAEPHIRNQPSADHRPHGKSSEQKQENNSIKEEKQETNVITKDVGFQKSLSETSTKDSKQIRDENVQLKSQLTCKVCMDRDTNTVVLPCGHFVSCDVCSRNLRKCVICRSKIKARVKAFMS